MSDVNLFLLASRNKWRFNSPKGDLNVEDLWDLPLTSTDSRKANLDDIARDLDKQVKTAEGERSFVKPATSKTSEIKSKFELVLLVINTKVAENDAAKAKADKEAKKQKLMALIDQKKDKALSEKTIEELQAEVNAL